MRRRLDALNTGLANNLGVITHPPVPANISDKCDQRTVKAAQTFPKLNRSQQCHEKIFRVVGEEIAQSSDQATSATRCGAGSRTTVEAQHIYTHEAARVVVRARAILTREEHREPCRDRLTRF